MWRPLVWQLVLAALLNCYNSQPYLHMIASISFPVPRTTGTSARGHPIPTHAFFCLFSSQKCVLSGDQHTIGFPLESKSWLPECATWAKVEASARRANGKHALTVHVDEYLRGYRYETLQARRSVLPAMCRNPGTQSMPGTEALSRTGSGGQRRTVQAQRGGAVTEESLQAEE